MAGIWPFLILFPWRILTLALGALVLGVYLIRMSSGTSHFRNLTIAMIIVMISFTGAVVFARLGSMDKQMNDYLSNSAIFSYLYDNRQHGSNWLMGKVMGIEENYLTVDCPSHDRPIKVMMNPLMMNQYKNGIVRGQDLDLIGRWRGLYSFEATAVKLINR